MMLFRPNLTFQLDLGNIQYDFTEHPSAKKMVYGQAGKRGTVYQIRAPQQKVFALKVFTQKYRSEDIEVSARLLAPLQNIPGLEVCQRQVLTNATHRALIAQYPELEYAVIMPWVRGETWCDILKSHPEFSQNDARYYAREFAEMMAGIEKRGLAHCDLSGPNLMIDFKTRRMALVDVEEMFGPGFPRPSIVPSGTAGYGHLSARQGMWSADADRFAGAVLIAEILARFDPRFTAHMREAVESFFDTEEIQADGAQYRLLMQILREHYSPAVCELFEQAWRSETLAACPRFADWAQALAGAPAQAASISATAAGPRLYSSDGSAPTRAGEPQEAQARSAPARQPGETPQVAPPPSFPAGGPVTAWRSLKPAGRAGAEDMGAATAGVYAPAAASTAGFPGTAGNLATAGSSASAGSSATAASATAVPAAGYAGATARPAPASSPASNISRGFAVAGLAAVAALLAFSSSIEGIKSFTQGTGFIAFYGLGSTGLALLLGFLQAWVFKERLKPASRFMYILMTAAGGLAGGALVGAITTYTFNIQGAYLFSALAGLIIGVVGGAVASLGQNAFLGNGSSAQKWFFFTVGSWGLIWAAGWFFSQAFPGTLGTALGAGVILLLSGIALERLLRSSPEIEF